MRRTLLPLIGRPEDGSLFTAPFGSSIVGSGQVLNDGSDATFVNYIGGGSYWGSPVEAAPKRVPSTARIWWRFKTSTALSQHTIRLRIFGSGDGASTVGHPPTYVGGYSEGQFGILGNPQDLFTALEGGLVTAETEHLGDPVNIYEGWIIVEVDGAAPPCRHYPREDDLGVGSGRHYPAPRSQQRSNRRFGYY